MQCVDAETLAAWADGGLPKPEAVAVELHLSECDRCTAMLATFVRTTPEIPATESLWQRWHLRWLVPVATAATVAALWVLIPRPEPVPSAISDTDVARQAQTQAPTPATAPPPSPADDTQEQKVADARTRSDRDAAVARPESPSAPSSARARDEAREAPQATPERRAAAAPPPAAEADRADQRTTDLQAKSEPPPPASAPAAPPAAAPAAKREAAGLSAAAEEPPARTLRQSNAQTFAAVVAQFEVVSPDPMTRWRVIGAGRVERSTDRGAQWQPAALPESATLTGGSSPAPSVCWLVGRAGAIYVTTDGLRFIRVPFRERTDFLSIQATDGRRATVVTTDGRTMRTEDQGATWIRIAP